MSKIKILDLLSGKNIWSYYQLYNKTQWYSEDEIKSYQLEKLRKLLKHCYGNVPYYKSIIDDNKIDIENFDSIDVLNSFPILTKETIQENYKLFLPINNNSIKGIKTSQTGGTTGNILIKRNDANTRSSIWASYKRYEDWMGLQKNDKTLILMGGDVKTPSLKEIVKNKILSLLNNSISINIYNTSNETIENIIKLLQTKSFDHIRSYPQFLYSVAQKLDQRGLHFNIKAISTTAEPIMSEHRILFKKVFNADVFDQYGCGEIGGIAYECSKHNGLHIADERVIIETNSLNELIITDLDNYTMPFIRYWNADQAVISNTPCKCGRKSKLIKEVMGRTCDYIIGNNGQFLHWAYFWHLIFDSNIATKRSLKKFQIVQNSENEIQIRLVSTTLSEDEKTFIISNMNERLGSINIIFTYESEIENSKNGKYRPVINTLITSKI